MSVISKNVLKKLLICSALLAAPTANADVLKFWPEMAGRACSSVVNDKDLMPMIYRISVSKFFFQGMIWDQCYKALEDASTKRGIQVGGYKVKHKWHIDASVAWSVEKPDGKGKIRKHKKGKQYEVGFSDKVRIVK